MKGVSIAFLILSFLAFLIFETQKSYDYQVLRIISPIQIVVDVNNNDVEDDGEGILLKDIQSFSTKASKEQTDLAKKLKISYEDALGMGFLAQNFAKETLEGKKVRLLNQNIFVEGKNYKKLITDRGFALLKGKAPSKTFLQNIQKIQKLHLVIFNNKSHKYHKLNCKYGLIAHNSQLIPVSQVPEDAKPCKFCFSKHKEYKKYEQLRKKDNISGYFDAIPDIKSPAVTFQKEQIKLFLTDETRVLKPNNLCNTSVCRALLSEINSAQSSIDFAIYGYTKIPAIEKALENAQQRGVKIRFVYDSDANNFNIYPDTAYLAKVFKDNCSDHLAPIMHDKFFIFDNKIVFTGSANIATTDMSGFNSNVILVINSDRIADIYEKEFEQMYNGRFHKAKLKIRDKQNDDISVYFSPKDKGIDAIIPLINNAKKYIYIPAFLVTYKELAESLIAAKNRGVDVKIILDATNTHQGSHSKLNELRKAGIQVKTENWAGKLHSKSIIIDDIYTIIGSMNFSRSGQSSNDENLLIIKDPQIAAFYRTYFLYLWKRIPNYWLTHNARAESPDSIGSCSDGIDNDFDGKIDKADESCKPVSFKENPVKKSSIGR